MCPLIKRNNKGGFTVTFNNKTSNHKTFKLASDKAKKLVKGV